jgi:Na+/proline symporter
MATSTLQWLDYVILAIFLVISLGIGFYHSVTGGRQKTIQEFIMANRKLGILPTAISMFVSFQSAIMILGSTAEMYQYGVQYLVWTPVSFAAAIIITERLIVPWIFPLKLVSINDVRKLQTSAWSFVYSFSQIATRCASALKKVVVVQVAGS